MHHPQSVEVSQYSITLHLRKHGFLLNIDEETLKALNVLLDVKCCEKSSFLVCVICGQILLLNLSNANDPCDCLKELFE